MSHNQKAYKKDVIKTSQVGALKVQLIRVVRPHRIGVLWYEIVIDLLDAAGLHKVEWLAAYKVAGSITETVEDTRIIMGTPSLGHRASITVGAFHTPMLIDVIVKSSTYGVVPPGSGFDTYSFIVNLDYEIKEARHSAPEYMISGDALRSRIRDRMPQVLGGDVTEHGTYMMVPTDEYVKEFARE